MQTPTQTPTKIYNPGTGQYEAVRVPPAHLFPTNQAPAMRGQIPARRTQAPREPFAPHAGMWSI